MKIKVGVLFGGKSVEHEISIISALQGYNAIDTNKYSSRKEIITGLTVYSEKYRLLGKIDIFDQSKGILTERKYSITAIYPGFRYQLYAQYIALTEMGFAVSELRLYSKKDNKVYPVALPDSKEMAEFEEILEKIRNFSLHSPFSPNHNKCIHCIYNSLCDSFISEE